MGNIEKRRRKLKRREERKADEHEQTWTPREGKDRPTPERRKRGQWAFVTTEDAGGKAARDMHAHPIDRLEHAGVISNDQASAARDFEDLYRACMEVGGTRDSTTIWEPQGHDSTDGPVEAKERYRELCRQIGIVRENALRQVCVFGYEPRRAAEIGALREALNEAGRFFAPQGLRGAKTQAMS